MGLWVFDGDPSLGCLGSFVVWGRALMSGCSLQERLHG